MEDSTAVMNPNPSPAAITRAAMVAKKYRKTYCSVIRKAGVLATRRWCERGIERWRTRR
jgi:hypothetical protein